MFRQRRILYIQYTNPAALPSLGHSSLLLARKGWDVLFLGTGSFGSGALRFPSNERITVKKISFCPAGWRQKLHYAWFTLWVLTWSLSWRPQWVYASDSLSCPVGLLLSFLPSIKVIYHEHDSPNTHSGIGTRHSAFIRFVLWARRRLARRAQIIVLPNGQRVDSFSVEMGSNHNVLCVWNCPAQGEISLPRLSHNSDCLRILYHGSIVPSRLPPIVLEALAILPKNVKLCIIGYETVGHKGYVQQLQNMACQLGTDERLEFLGAISSRSDLFKYCQQCDIGLSLVPRNSKDVNEQTMTGASNKPFDYLACGLALLVSDLPDWRAMYVDPGYGLACNPDDPESIASAVRWFCEHPDEMRKMGERGRQRIVTEWNYEKQFLPVWEKMNAKFL